MRWSWMVSTLAACGGKSYCEKSVEWFACGEEVEITDEELADCEEALEPCSNADQKNLIDATECLLDLGLFGFCDSTEDTTGTVTTEEAVDLAEAAAECEAFSAAVSAECNAALSFGTSTFTSSGSTY